MRVWNYFHNETDRSHYETGGISFGTAFEGISVCSKWFSLTITQHVNHSHAQGCGIIWESSWALVWNIKYLKASVKCRVKGEGLESAGFWLKTLLIPAFFPPLCCSWWPLGTIGCGRGMEGMVAAQRGSRTVFTKMRTLQFNSRKRGRWEVSHLSWDLFAYWWAASFHFFSHVQGLLHK